MPRDKNVKITETSLTNNSFAIERRIIDLQEIVKRTIIAVQRYKTLDVFGANELNVCVQSLESCFITLGALQNPGGAKLTESAIVSQLQDVTNELSALFRTFGTESIEDLLSVCFGADYAATHFNTPELSVRYALMKEHVHPIGYKIMAWKADTQTKDNATPLRKN